MPNNNDKETKKVKILLAEDDKFISRAYMDGLSRAGYEVIPASDGAEALTKLKDVMPDLMMLDLIMPIKNGFEVLAEVRQDERLKRVPVIIVSNLGQESDIQKGRELGANDYLIKANYSMAEVLEKVANLLKLNEADQA